MENIHARSDAQTNSNEKHNISYFESAIHDIRKDWDIGMK